MKNLTHAYVAGGGGQNSSLNSLSTKSLNNSKRFFTPIVASSLALFLSAGVANAAALSCPTSATAGEPRICYEYNENTPTSGENLQNATLNNFTWEASTTSTGSDIFTPKSGATPISQLNFQFNTGANGQPAGTPNGNSYTITSGGNGKTQLIVIDGGTKGIEMAQNGNNAGKLVVDFNVGPDAKRQFHLNLSQSTGPFSFKGEIIVYAGKGWPNGEDGTSKFVGEFGKDVEGKIVINRRGKADGRDQSGHRTELIFLDGASLTGDLATGAGTTTTTFVNGSIKGKLIANDTWGYWSNAKNIVTFNGQGNKIEGGISAVGANLGGGIAHNIVTFEQGGTIEGAITSSTMVGLNQITMKGASGIISGDITIDRGKNVILMESTTGELHKVLAKGDGVNEITMNSDTSTIKGAVQAFAEVKRSVTSTNKITFKKSNATIEGAVSVKGNNYAKARGANFITFEQGGTIKGEVIATSGENQITFGGTGDAALELKVQANLDNIRTHRAKNTITMESSGTNIIKGGVHEQKGNNIITMGGTTATIENGVKAISSAFNNVDGSGNTTFGNTITMTAETNTIKDGVSSDEGRNVITFGASDAPVKTATIEGDIVAEYSKNGGWGSGNNKITFYADNATISGNVVAQDVGGNAINTIDLGSGNLTIGGSVTSSSGRRNIINTKEGTTLTITGGLSGSWGSNTITGDATQATLNGTITANGGTNTIELANGTLAIKPTTKAPVNITATNGTNALTARLLDLNLGSISTAGSGKNTITGEGTITATTITTKGGATIITLGASSTLTATTMQASGGTSTITAKGSTKLDIATLEASSGSNNINLEGASSLASSASITASGGTNAITIAQGAHSTLSITNLKANSGTNSILLDNAKLNLDIKNAESTSGTNQITLKGESKLFNQSAKLTLDKLIFEDARFYPEDFAKDIGTQKSTIVDLASMPRDAKSFRLLEIGRKAVAGSAGGTTGGLQGENGLFRVLVGKSDSASGNKLGGVDANSTSSTYGYAYSDRVIVHDILDASGAASTNPIDIPPNRA